MIRIDEGEVRGHPAKMVHGTVEETLNALLGEGGFIQAPGRSEGRT
ncbi:MAG: hypothetical protein OXE51_00185 [Gammaproteobacteria bacterium]|nr:hypothetical protein [Gammaproteobacteria bacterium]